MRAVPMVDGSGATAIKALIERCHRHGTALIMTGVQAQPRQVLQEMGIIGDPRVTLVPDIDAALVEARRIVAAKP